MNTNTLQPEYGQIAETFLLSWDAGDYDSIPASVFILEIVERCQKLAALRQQADQQSQPEGKKRETIFERILELVQQHGSLRAVARVKQIDAGYLVRLSNGEKVNPSAATLRKLGLKQVVTYQRVKP